MSRSLSSVQDASFHHVIDVSSLSPAPQARFARSHHRCATHMRPFAPALPRLSRVLSPPHLPRLPFAWGYAYLRARALHARVLNNNATLSPRRISRGDCARASTGGCWGRFHRSAHKGALGQCWLPWAPGLLRLLYRHARFQLHRVSSRGDLTRPTSFSAPRACRRCSSVL
jgi:hypothetical protein